MSFDPRQPFVLLDDSRITGAKPSKLFAAPSEIVTAHTPEEVRPALDRLRAATASGQIAAGFLAFEAGYALEPKLLPRFRDPGGPLLWFGLFDRRQWLTGDEVAAMTAGRAGVTGWSPGIAEADQRAAVDAARALIAAGDIYQVNLTFPASVRYDGHPLALYGHLRQAQRAPYSALIHTGDGWLLSLSPELFVMLKDGDLTARPMKGTAARLPLPAADRAAAKALAADAKNRAENLMIVDLLRNDLSRVAAPGSVETPSLFDIETYPTVHQMTSTVTAKLRPGLDAIDLLAALYPCGSITGAPKIRAMEVIADLEPTPRGPYTGAIGFLTPEGDAMFNVAIRTLVTDGGGTATLGLGSGIVADSEPAAEWAECLAKAVFLDRATRPFDLVETLRFEPGPGLLRVERHLARLRASAAWHGFVHDGHAIRDALQQVAIGREPRRVRLLLAPGGAVAVHTAPLPPTPAEPVLVALARLPVAATDPRLAHKTTDRAFYDDARHASGAFEVLFTTPDGQLTEGSFTNLFVPRDGRLATPPLTLGLLPGILRAELLDSGEAFEAPLTPADLADGFLIGNSLRGLLRARLATP